MDKNRIYFLRPLRSVWLITAEKLTDLFDFFLLAVPVFVLEFLLNFHQALLLFDEAIHTIIRYYFI